MDLFKHLFWLQAKIKELELLLFKYYLWKQSLVLDSLCSHLLRASEDFSCFSKSSGWSGVDETSVIELTCDSDVSQ